MKIEEILNEREKKQIQKFAANSLMMQAVKKVFLYGMYQSGTLKPGEEPDTHINFALSLVMDSKGNRYHLSNKEVGEKLKACAEGIVFLEDGFAQLKAFNEPPKQEVIEGNPAR